MRVGFWLQVAAICVLFIPFASAHAQPSAPFAAGSVEDRRKTLTSLFQEFWEDFLAHNPEFASQIGDKRFDAKTTDYSARAQNERIQREQEYLLKLAAIDPAGLTESETMSREVLMRWLGDEVEESQFKPWEMPLNQMEGIYISYPQLVASLSFKTVEDYENWIARLKALPNAFDQVTENMTIGMEDHRVPPKFLLEKALEQVKQLAAQRPEDSPLALPLKKFPASIAKPDQDRIREEMLSVIGKQVLPAYQRLARFMQASYVPAGRTEPGISSLADGAKYYRFLVRRTTTTALTPDQIHQIGLDEVKKDEADMLALAQKLGFKDLASFRASLKDNAKLHPTSREALLDAYNGYLEPMKAKLPQLFGRLPKASFKVEPVPEYREKTSAPAYYEPGTADGSRPGRLFIDTYDARHRNLYDAESTAYHEGLPGHHLQISIAQELTDVPEFRKHVFFTAYTEGWGLYSERLGKDVGFYQDPYSDYGRLENDIWRAIRLVVDTGVHSKHWTREQMVDFFHQHSNVDEPSVQAEVDRYIAWPSQALAYKVGQLKILQLRDKARAALGSNFDIRTFHDQVLDAGALPLDLLETRIDQWIAAQKQK